MKKQNDFFIFLKNLKVHQFSIVCIGLIFSALFCIMPPLPADAEPNPDLAQPQSASYDPMYTLQAMNMAMVSLYKIAHFSDRVVLDQEYSEILSNFSYGDVKNDPAVVAVFKKILDTITEQKLATQEINLIQKLYARKTSVALQDSLVTATTKTALPNTLFTFGSLYFNYFKTRETYAQELGRDLFRMEKEQTQTLNALRAALFDAFWSTLRLYNLPDSLRLTEKTIEQLLDAVSDPDIDRSLRKFENISADFEGYPPFWSEYGKIAQEKGLHDLALRCYAQYENQHRKILREDPFYAEVCKGRILLTPPSDRKEIEQLLALLLANTSPEDWTNRTFAALQYAALDNVPAAQECLQRNIDLGYNVDLHTHILEALESGSLDIPKALLDYFRETDPDYVFRTALVRAEQGDPSEQSLLGTLYYQGSGVKQNTKEAVKWYQRSAEQNYVWGKYNLGLLYAKGQGVPKNKETANRYLQAALPELQEKAKSGNMDAQYALGDMYYHAYGVKRDYKSAAKWLEMAALQGHAPAQSALGNLYLEGLGVKKDRKKANEWFQKAAKQGNRQAQKKLKVSPWSPAYWWPW